MRKLFLVLASGLLFLTLAHPVSAAQHDYIISNADGATVRADINAVLQAIVSLNSNNTAPATTYAYQWWLNTSNGTLCIRNSANTAWLDVVNATTGSPSTLTSFAASAGNYTRNDAFLTPYSLFNTALADTVSFTRAANAGSGNQTVSINYSFTPRYISADAGIGSTTCGGKQNIPGGRHSGICNYAGANVPTSAGVFHLYYNSTLYYTGKVISAVPGGFVFQWQASEPAAAAAANTMTVNTLVLP